jgi:hypothetical protein
MEVNDPAQKESPIVEALDYNSFCKLLLKFKAEYGEETVIYWSKQIYCKNFQRFTYLSVCSLTSSPRTIWIRSNSD